VTLEELPCLCFYLLIIIFEALLARAVAPNAHAWGLAGLSPSDGCADSPSSYDCGAGLHRTAHSSRIGPVSKL
jgi:hypothetical protein